MKNLTKLFFVVIHIKNWKQALDEAVKVLIPTGAHGVIFICHNGSISSGSDYPNIFDTVITSGDATGSPPTLEKIKHIREWIGPEKRLGNASGIGEENIDEYLPYIDTFLIATKICVGDGKGENFYYADLEKVLAVRVKIDAYEKNNS